MIPKVFVQHQTAENYIIIIKTGNLVKRLQLLTTNDTNKIQINQTKYKMQKQNKTKETNNKQTNKEEKKKRRKKEKRKKEKRRRKMSLHLSSHGLFQQRLTFIINLSFLRWALRMQKSRSVDIEQCHTPVWALHPIITFSEQAR